MRIQDQEVAPPKEKISIWRVLGTLLSLALLIYLVLSQGWDSFLEVLKSIPIQYFLIALGLAIMSRLFVTLRWFILLRSAGVALGFTTCLRLVFMGLFASNFLPSTVGGDLARLAGAIALRVDAPISAASLVVDRLVGMAGMALLLPFGLVAITQPVSGLRTNPQPVFSMGLLAVPGVKWLWDRLTKFIRDLLRSSVYWLRSPSRLGLALLCTLGHQLCTYLIIWLLLQGMQQNASIITIAGLWSLSYFFSLAPLSINGLGLQEVSIAYLYTHFVGIPVHAGLALALLMRMIFLIISLPGGFFLPDILRRKVS